MRSQLSVVGLNSIASGILSTKSFPTSIFCRVLPVFSSGRFRDSGFKLRSLNPLWLVSVKSEGEGLILCTFGLLLGIVVHSFHPGTWEEEVG